jgi:thiosulfate/3-mercaptopyruvate sulfurtransferase
MAYVNAHALVSSAWLGENIGAENVVVLDGTSHLPTTGRDAASEFAQKHIPGALRFNIDAIADPDATLPHMLPSADLFAQQVGAMGISNATRVIVYDVYGLQSAARVWWMFRIFGHDKVALLSGGLPKWESEGRPVSDATTVPDPVEFKAAARPELVRSIDNVLANIASGTEQVLDARAAGRFTGEQPEPRAGMRSGHIPNSISMPFTDLLTKERMFLPEAELREALNASGTALDKPITASCGSGVTACVIALACYLLGKDDVAIYDGSWSEWGARADTPIDTGGWR